MNDKDLKKLLFKFYFDTIEVECFEKSIYGDSTLEDRIGSDDYIDLISINYKNKSDHIAAKEMIERVYSREFSSDISKDYAVYVAKETLIDGADLFEGCRILSKLSIDYENVDPVFCGYYDELRSHPGQIDFYRSRILNDLKKIAE